MTLTIPVDKIINELLTISEITNITGTRIYFGEPVFENQQGIYLVLNLISDLPVQSVERFARVEFRIIAHNSEVTKKQLVTLIDIINQKLVYDECLWKKDYDWFKVYVVEEWNSLILWTSDKNRNVLIKDFIFKYVF